MMQNTVALILFTLTGGSDNFQQCQASAPSEYQIAIEIPAQCQDQEPDLPSKSALTPTDERRVLKLIYSSDFTSDVDDWDFTDAKAWKFDVKEKVPVLSQFRKESTFKPSVRSPLHRAILKSPSVGSFELTVEICSTHPPYGHRDACLFFGYQSPTEFYYVHLGQSTDPHCNQVFIVNKADREKISLTTSKGTPWDKSWHRVRIVRDIQTGKIEVYFDDRDIPVMTASDKTFLSGRVGIGSFDDTADWTKFRLYEILPENN